MATDPNAVVDPNAPIDPNAPKKVAVPQMTPATPTPTPIPIAGAPTLAPAAPPTTPTPQPQVPGVPSTATTGAAGFTPQAPTPLPITPAPALASAPPAAPAAPASIPIAPAPQTFDQLSAATADPNFNNPYTGQPSGPTDDQGRPLGPDGKFHGAQGPTFTLGEGGQPSTVQQPGGGWTNADGTPLAAGKNQWGESIATGPAETPSNLSLPAMQAALDADKAKNPSGVQSPLPSVGGAFGAPNTAATDATGSIPIAGAPGAGTASSPSLATSPAGNAIPIAGVNGPNLVDSTGAGDYTGKTIQPGAATDRFGIAQSRFDQAAKASDPYYQKTLRDANTSAAATGRLGSGMLRTSLGDAASNRELQLDTLRKGFLTDATEGSIGDAYKNIGIAQQQQGFQAGQQNTAFSQEMQAQLLDEALRNGDFNRYYQLLNAGNQGNPSDTALSLSSSYGNQSTAAAQGASNLVSGAVNADTQRRIAGGSAAGAGPTGGVDPSTMTTEQYLAYLESLGIDSGGAPSVQQTTGTGIPIATGYGGSVYQPPRPPGA